MIRLHFVLCAIILALAVFIPARSEARIFVGVGFGGGCCWGPGWGYGGPWGYSAAYAPYYASPPVVYAAPPPPTVIYAQPAATTYVVPAPVMASPASPVFVDGLGRTCRQFQGATPSTVGTACLQADGSWRVVQ